MIGTSLPGRIQSTCATWTACPCNKTMGQYNNGALTVRYADYYGMSSTRNFAKLFTNEMSSMSDTEAARALADIIYKAPGTVALENIADAISNICRFMEEPCDPRLGLRPELQEKLGRIFFQMKKNDGPAFESLMKAYTFRPSMADRINLWVSEARYNALESGRLRK